MAGKAFIIQSEGLGRGDDKLGKLLMANFLRLLGVSHLPNRGGVDKTHITRDERLKRLLRLMLCILTHQSHVIGRHPLYTWTRLTKADS